MPQHPPVHVPKVGSMSPVVTDQEPGTPIAALADSLAMQRLVGQGPGTPMTDPQAMNGQPQSQQQLIEAAGMPRSAGVTQTPPTPTFHPPTDLGSLTGDPGASEEGEDFSDKFGNFLARLTTGRALKGLLPAQEARARREGMIKSGLYMILAGQPGQGMTTAGAIAQGLLAGQQAGEAARMREQVVTADPVLDTRKGKLAYLNQLAAEKDWDGMRAVWPMLELDSFAPNTKGVDPISGEKISGGHRTRDLQLVDTNGKILVTDKNDPDGGWESIMKELSPAESHRAKQDGRMFMDVGEGDTLRRVLVDTETGEELYSRSYEQEEEPTFKQLGNTYLAHDKEGNVLWSMESQGGPDLDTQRVFYNDFQRVKKPHSDSSRAFATLLDPNGDENAYKQHAMLFEMLEILDPDSVKRESEIAALAAIIPGIDKIWLAGKKALTGVVLLPEQIAQIRAFARMKVEHYLDLYNKDTAFYHARAEQAGLLPGELASPYSNLEQFLQPGNEKPLPPFTVDYGEAANRDSHLTWVALEGAKPWITSKN